MTDKEKTFKSGKKVLHPVLMSKKIVYEEPPKNIADAQEGSKKRLLDRKKAAESFGNLKKDVELGLETPMDEKAEKVKQETLIGQLKAAESRNRLRIMRLRYQMNREREIRHLISCQPTALRAVRLQALLPQKLFHEHQDDSLSKIEREKVERLLENDITSGNLV